MLRMAGNHDEVPSVAARFVGGPDATAATSPAEFVAAMRELKSWTGLSYRQLEARAARCGMVLPRSTLMNALGRTTLPREELVAAFVRACGCDDDDTAGWLVARRRLAAAGSRTRPTTVGRTTASLVQAEVMVFAVAAVLVLAIAVAWLAAG